MTDLDGIWQPGTHEDSNEEDQETAWLRDNVFDAASARHPKYRWSVLAFLLLAVVVLAAGVWTAAGLLPGNPGDEQVSEHPFEIVADSGILPGFQDAPQWTFVPPTDAAKGSTSLGLVLVTPGQISLRSIRTGEQVFEAPLEGAVTSTLAVRFTDRGGPDVLLWTSADSVSWYDTQLHVLPVDPGCVVSATGGSPLVSCPDAVSYWINGGALEQISTPNGATVLAVSGQTAIAANVAEFQRIDLPSGEMSVIELQSPGDSWEIARLAGVSGAWLITVWSLADTGESMLTLHDTAGVLTASTSISVEAASAKLVRGIGSQAATMGDVLIVLGGAPKLLTTGCQLGSAVGSFAPGRCDGIGDGVFRLGVFYPGGGLPVATSPDGSWAMIDSQGKVQGLSVD